MMKFSLQFRFKLYLCACLKHKFESKHLSNIWWTHKTGLTTCLDRQIRVWSIWTGEIWSKFKGNIWSLKTIKKLSSRKLNKKNKPYPFKSVKELMQQHAYRHSLLDSFHSLKTIFDWIRSTIVKTLRGLPPT